MNKVVIIDGNSLLFRAYYATSYGDTSNIMRTKDGIPTNALFAFSNMISRLMSTLKEGDYIFVGFDTGHKTFRHEEDKDYKANRKPCPEELKVQMPLARELLRNLNIFTFEKEGFEGDDVCGTVATMAKKEGKDVHIYTSDRDFLQLVDSEITVDLLKKGLSNIEEMTPEKVKETFGVLPTQITDYKGLVGDDSDNLPGIPGIGPKSAAKLLEEYGSLENIIANAQSIKGKMGENIALNKEKGEKSKHLAIIKTDIDLPFKVEDLLYNGYSYDGINAFCTRYELKQFLSRLPSKYREKSGDDMDVEIIEVSSFKDIKIDEKIAIAIDREDTNYNQAQVYGLLIYSDSKAYYMEEPNIAKDDYLKKILEDKNIKKYGYDLKAVKVILSRYAIKLLGIAFDTMIASYILDSSLKNDPDSIYAFLGKDITINNKDEISLFSDANPKKSALIAKYALELEGKVLSELDKEASLNLFKEIEIPLIVVLSDMEIEGFPLDEEELLDIGEEYRNILSEETKIIHSLAKKEFNIDSPKQVGEVLFEDLKLRNPKKGSTSSEVLQEISEEHPIVNEILTYRKYSKLVSTYIDGLRSYIYPDKKLHSIFNQAITATGRLSSSEPNLQNISIRDEEGKKIRKAFYYPNYEYDILSLDYSQIELRILAYLSNSATLKEAFIEDRDIHEATAKKIFKVDEVTPEMRRRAKTVNFGIIYGISDWGLSEQLGVGIKEAKEIINNFYEAFPEINDYYKGVFLDANKNGFVSTMFGRRRYLAGLHDSNFQKREFAKRAAMNAPIQGSAADLIKIAMIKTNNLLVEGNYNSKLINQIHDELIFKIDKKEKNELIPKIKEIMESVLTEGVPLKVSYSVGKSWFEAK